MLGNHTFSHQLYTNNIEEHKRSAKTVMLFQLQDAACRFLTVRNVKDFSAKVKYSEKKIKVPIPEVEDPIELSMELIINYETR